MGPWCGEECSPVCSQATRRIERSRRRLGRRRGNILEIPVDDAVVVQVLHAEQDGTGDKTKRISLSLLSPGEEQSTYRITDTASRSERWPC